MKQSHDHSHIPQISGATIHILQSKWHKEHTDMIVAKCTEILEGAGAKVSTSLVPGSLELPLAAQILLKKEKLDTIVCVGVIMKGETDHYDMILQSCAIGLEQVSLQYNTPVLNGILPVSKIEHVIARSSDDEFNKGIELALACAEFIEWRKKHEA
jgi:6,7-dimethyl-8-ribityllumazine synthase